MKKQSILRKLKEEILKVTPHDERSFYKTAHCALDSYVFPVKFDNN